MKNTKLTLILTVFLLVTVMVTISQAGKLQKSYWMRGKPSCTPLPPEGDANSPWKTVPDDGVIPGGGNDLELEKNEQITIASKNTEASKYTKEGRKIRKKTWTIKITVYGDAQERQDAKSVLTDRGHISVSSRYEGQSGWKTDRVDGDVQVECSTDSSGNPVYKYTINFKDQPLQERITFMGPKNACSVGKWKIKQWAVCMLIEKKTEDGSSDPNGTSVKFEKCSVGSVNTNWTFHIKEFWCFPLDVMVDISVAPFCDMNNVGGTWNWSFVSQEPNNGDPRPQGGVKWSTSGNGIEVEQEFDFGFTMVDVADDFYDVFFYDADTDSYIEGLSYIGPRPLITEIKSYTTHDGSEFGVEIEQSRTNVEPRLSGIEKLKLKFAVPMNPNSTTEPNNFLIMPAGDLELTGNIYLSMADSNNQILTVQFSPVLPCQYCYKINVQGMQTASDFLVTNGVFPVRSLVGDVTRDGYVSQADVDEVDLYLGQSTNSQNAHCDIDYNGYVNTDDRSHVQNRLNNEVSQCAGLCGDADHPYPEGDVDLDCDVDMTDFASVAGYWLYNACIPPNCEDY